ncbi:MAG: aminotransferase class I/II-fold pyridoxal phosphate-dependent enzyme [Thermoproteota archaeon]|nr:aminotransferase class I/II-fold pyridoxal phosphate-dependent enzyme [Thermoproteota archaeon]
MTVDKLDNLRYDMKNVTQQIVSLINQRMEIAKKIGEIKSELQLNVIDDRVEQEIKNYILQNSNDKGLDPEFSGRIINLLINESVIIQNHEKNKKELLNRSITNQDKTLLKKINNTRSENNNSNNLKIRTHMDVFNKAKQLDSLGRKIIHMEVGEPDFSPPPQVKEELMLIYDKHRYHYTETAGIGELRKKLSTHISHISENPSNNIQPENIVTTVGGRFAIFCTFSALLRPGDEVIIIEPAWPAYKDCANYLGIKSKIIRTNLEGKWEPDISLIENSININTKIICLNYPNNPTGKILSEEKLKSIIQIAEKNNLYILSDEVYCNFAFKKFSSVLKFPYENSIMIGSFSKTYSMTGFRVGFAYSINKDLINKLIKIQALSLTSVPEPMQYCALAALSYNPSEFNQIMNKRIDFVCSKLKNMPFEFVHPDGAMYVYAKINEELAIDDLTLIERLLERGVAVAPGSGFGDDYSNYIRISTCIDEDKLNLGLDIINQLVTSF